MDEKEPTPNDYGFPAEELEGRFVETPLGRETCVMKRILWAYFDWLKEQGFNPDALIRNCYNRHPELDISRSMTWQLHHLAAYRQENNLENPSWLIAAPLPPGFEEF